MQAPPEVDESLNAQSLRRDPAARLAHFAEWPEFDVEHMLRRLTAAGVDFVVVGGIAGSRCWSPAPTT